MREFVTTVWRRGVEETMRLTAVNEGRMQSVINRYERETGDTIDVSAKTMVEVIQRDGLGVVITERPFLRYVFKTAMIVADTVMRASWQVLRAASEAGFILCDTPVVVVPPQGVRQVGFLVPGAVTYIPLSREACLKLSQPGDNRIRYTGLSSETVALVNQNIAANSIRFIMSPWKEELEEVVARSGCETAYATPRTTFRRHSQDDDGSYDSVTMNARNYFYLPNGRAP